LGTLSLAAIMASGAAIWATRPNPSALTAQIPKPDVESSAEPSPAGSNRPTTEPPSRSLERQRVTATGSCAASFYWEPQPTASGERFDPEALTAAHKTLPFNTRVRVTNPANGRSVVVRINDRGPYVAGRCLDLSRAAFRTIANLDTGVLKSVRYEILA
jgi:peptidoglycan lytic transglycosylase